MTTQLNLMMLGIATVLGTPIHHLEPRQGSDGCGPNPLVAVISYAREFGQLVCTIWFTIAPKRLSFSRFNNMHSDSRFQPSTFDALHRVRHESGPVALFAANVRWLCENRGWRQVQEKRRREERHVLGDLRSFFRGNANKIAHSTEEYQSTFPGRGKWIAFARSGQQGIRKKSHHNRYPIRRNIYIYYSSTKLHCAI